MKHRFCMDYKNVRLRPLEEGDIEKLRFWRNDSSNSTYLSKIPYITGEMQLKWFNSYLERKDEMVFAIEETETFDRMVGSLSLYEIKDNVCLFGKFLIGDAETRGCGIGTHSTEAALKIATEQLGISRIVLYVYQDNAAALGVYKHAGFKMIDEHQDSDDKMEYMMEYRK